MSTYPNEAPDPEDMFADTRMSFGDHIEDLRTHLLRALKGFMIGMVLGIWPLGKVVLGIITGPVEEQLREFEMKKVGRDFDLAKTQIDSGELRLPPIYIEIELLRPGPEEKGPPVLEKTVRYYEKMMFRLEVHDFLDDELRNRTRVEKVEARIGNPYVFARNMMETAAQVRRPGLTTLSITEGFFVYFKVDDSFVNAFVSSE